MSKSKIREKVFKAQDTQVDYVACPEWADEEWDGTVKMRGLTGTERDDFEASCQQLRKSRDERTGKQVREAVPVLTNIRAKLVVKCALDPDDDTRLFTDQDAPALGEKSGKPSCTAWSARTPAPAGPSTTWAAPPNGPTEWSATWRWAARSSARPC
jgi:hypothetical protein